MVLDDKELLITGKSNWKKHGDKKASY